jgi:prevent-host-death family protein
MLRQVNIHEAKTHLSALLEQVRMGNDVIIAKAGEPIARLTAVNRPRGPRKPGSARGQIKLRDSFFDPLPPDVLDSFYK